MRDHLVLFLCGSSALVFILACGGFTPATWWLNGSEASDSELVGAVMDLWAGDPGPICFKGESQSAAEAATRAFAGSEQFVSAAAASSAVTITTKSPFGDGETSGNRFTACP